MGQSAVSADTCPLCRASSAEVLLQREALQWQSSARTSPFTFTLSLCSRCGFLYQASAYTDAYQGAVSEIYAQFYKSSTLPFPYRSPENLSTMDMLAPCLSAATPFFRVLEIGSNRGDLLYLLKERFPTLNVLGLEPSRFTDLPVPTVNSLFRRDLFASRFDLIVMQHVLEHMLHPREVAAELHDLLAPGGYLYVEVPDIERSLAAGVEDFSLEHVSYFDLDSLSRALAGFELVASDRKTFLKSLWRRTDVVRPSEAPASAPTVGRRRAEVTQFVRRKGDLVRDVQALAASGRRVVFYGNSFYFRLLYREIVGQLQGWQLAYFDDFFTESSEPAFGLPRAATFQPGDVVVLCSNNPQVQERMVESLARTSGLTTVRPWSAIVTTA